MNNFIKIIGQSADRFNNWPEWKRERGEALIKLLFPHDEIILDDDSFNAMNITAQQGDAQESASPAR